MIGTYQDCMCCLTSTRISSAIQTCPDSDLSVIGGPTAFQDARNDVAGLGGCPILGSNRCSKELGRQPVPAGIFYNPLSFPPGVPGTKPVSEVGSFTTFPGRQTTTITMFPGYSSVITMVPWKGVAGGATGAGQPTATATNAVKSTASTTRISAGAVLLAIILFTVACA